MTTIQVKLRHSGVQGKAGTIYYQITRGRKTRRIATHLRIAPEHWLPAAQRIAPAISQTPEGRLLRYRIERDSHRYAVSVRELDTRRGTVTDRTISSCDSVSWHSAVTVAESMRREIDELTNSNRSERPELPAG